MNLLYSTLSVLILNSGENNSMDKFLSALNFFGLSPCGLLFTNTSTWPLLQEVTFIMMDVAVKITQQECENYRCRFMYAAVDKYIV